MQLCCVSWDFGPRGGVKFGLAGQGNAPRAAVPGCRDTEWPQNHPTPSWCTGGTDQRRWAWGRMRAGTGTDAVDVVRAVCIVHAVDVVHAVRAAGAAHAADAAALPPEGSDAA